MTMQFPEVHKSALRKPVMVSGIFRSGTTIVGKLIGSFKNAEYAFEPPFVFYIDGLLQNGAISSELAADLLKAYFTEDVMIEYHHGRRYNTRKQDDSCVFNMKSKEEVERRWNGVNNSQDAIRLLKELKSRLVFKAPAAYSVANTFFSQFEGAKVIEVQRNVKDTLRSILRKKWFSDESLEKADKALRRPFEDVDGLHVPYFMPKDVSWKNMTEETRAAQVLNVLVGKSLAMRRELKERDDGRFLLVKYEDLVENPREEVQKIVDFLEMESTPKTEEIIASIRQRKQQEQGLEGIEESTARELLENNRRLGY